MRHANKLLAACGGLLFALATPPTDLYPLVFVGLVAYALVIQRATTVLAGFGLGWLWATAASLVGMRFVPSVITLFTPLGMPLALLAHVLLSAAQSLHWAIGAAIAVALRKRLATPIEVAAAAGTLVAVSLPSIFLWTPAGLLSPWPVLLQTADVIGERGLSASMAAAMAAIARTVTLLIEGQRRKASWFPAICGLAGLAALCGHGSWAMRRAVNHQLIGEARIALVYAAVEPRERWDRRNWPRILSQLRQQTALAETAGIDLSIWPEAAYPYPLSHEARAMPTGQREIIGGAIDGPVLFGYLASAKPYQNEHGELVHDAYNAATIVTPDGFIQPSYDKMQLLWFGETIPLGEYFPWLKRTFQRGGGILPGKELRPQHLDRSEGPDLHIGVLNCYEDTLPELGRRLAKELAPNLLVNVTNDAWFVGTVEAELHLRLSVLRAIELRRDLVRSVNLGYSAWIDASGAIRAHKNGTEPGFFVVTPSLRQGPLTTYALLGDLPLWIAIALGSAASWARHRRGSRDATDAATS
jgi:apolipoprotein N-acyltransferase